VFSHIELDNKLPVLRSNDRVDMDVDGGPLLVSTAEAGGSFSVLPAEGYQRQYLADVAPANRWDEQFDQTLQGTTKGHDRTVSDRVLSEITVFDRRLTSQQWPPKEERDISPLVGADKSLSKCIQRLISANFPSSGIQDPCGAQGVAASHAATPLRAALGLPPPS